MSARADCRRGARRLAQPERGEKRAAALAEQVGVLARDPVLGEDRVHAVLDRRAQPRQRRAVPQQLAQITQAMFRHPRRVHLPRLTAASRHRPPTLRRGKPRTTARSRQATRPPFVRSPPRRGFGPDLGRTDVRGLPGRPDRRYRSCVVASVPRIRRSVLALDEDQASAGARSAPHRAYASVESNSHAPAIAFHTSRRSARRVASVAARCSYRWQRYTARRCATAASRARWSTCSGAQRFAVCGCTGARTGGAPEGAGEPA